jgi:cytochrome oxidase Cu insertion factor (SCO1/SenC/PrrC family)
MKTFILSIALMLGITAGAFAQGNSHAARSVNQVRQNCNSSFFQGNTWDITATLEYETRCAYSPLITGPGEVYIVVASYHCTSEICPLIADQIIGRVIWCGQDIDYTECY